MAKTLREWLDADVRPVRDKPLRWLSEEYFFRDPARPAYCDTSWFFSPADGIVVYQREVDPADPIVDIKGRAYSLREAMRDRYYDRRSVVVGVFMTFYDVHVNRVPYRGRLTYRKLDAIHTHNRSMLAMERGILEELGLPMDGADYLHDNERVLNRIWSDELGDTYYVLQIADYDVDSITPLELNQNQPVNQGARFSQIRYGSQVELILPLSSRFDYEIVQPTGVHVEAGVDPLIRVRPKNTTTQ
jgi:phosphatidylserine decarboxylase